VWSAVLLGIFIGTCVQRGWSVHADCAAEINTGVYGTAGERMHVR